MKIAVSNILWGLDDTSTIARLMSERGIAAVEIAPTTKWIDPLAAPSGQLNDFRSFWEDQGIRIVALQALLYGHAELTIFDQEPARERTLEYLRGMMRVGRALGADVLVFGSPKNRRVGDKEPGETQAIALDFFRRAGEAASDEGVTLCIEPNPGQYGCDFVTTADEGLELVRSVDHPGFGLHLDSAGMTLAEDPVQEALDRCASYLRHFHVSEPFLAPIGEGGVAHQDFAGSLRQLGYEGFCSVEMKKVEGRDVVTEIDRVLTLVEQLYR